MSAESPNAIVLAGPNGSGKSTAAPSLLRDYLGVVEFVNADAIALGLSGFAADTMAFQAGRIMLERLEQLEKQRVDFAFETTLASKSFAARLRRLRQDGYRMHLIFLWLPSAEMALARVASRVQQGGHDIPEATVRRRYEAGLRNFFQLYRPIADTWVMFDNSRVDGYELIASQSTGRAIEVANDSIWQTIAEHYQ